MCEHVEILPFKVFAVAFTDVNVYFSDVISAVEATGLSPSSLYRHCAPENAISVRSL